MFGWNIVGSQLLITSTLELGAQRKKQNYIPKNHNGPSNKATRLRAQLLDLECLVFILDLATYQMGLLRPVI